MVVEGAYACQTLLPLAKKAGVEMPITEAVRRVIWEGADPRAAGMSLSDRPLKQEFYGLG